MYSGDDLLGIVIVHFIGIELFKRIMQKARPTNKKIPKQGVQLATIVSAKAKRAQQRRTIEMSAATVTVLQEKHDGAENISRPLQSNVVLSRRTIGANWQQSSMQKPSTPSAPHRLPTNANGVRLTKHIAMDCEMVGIGYMGKKHMLARVSIINQMGEVLMDKFCKPWQPVIDYRTEISGIRPENLVNGEKFEIIQKEVTALLHNRILVGHAIYNDLKVLVLAHPPHMIRDTARYRPLINRVTGGSTPSLRVLALCVLNKRIQEGEHSSVEDARAAMQIFNRFQEDWERNARRKHF